MFLRCTTRKKNGKEHRYWNLVENRRVAGGQVIQRQVLYLGEINDSQREVWRKSIEVFEDGRSAPRTVALFAEEQTAPIDDEQVIQVRLKDLEVRNARQWGGCWLVCELYEQLKLDQFWAERLPPGRKGTRWDLILQTLCIYRFIEPGSEWRLHRYWFDRSAVPELLGSDFRLAESHRLYECHDLLLKHKGALFTHLTERWKDLFNAKFDILLYDLTSTYFECDPPIGETDKRKFGHSRDKRSDCVQVVIALIVTPEGFPLAYEVLAGNTSDKTTLRDFLKKIEAQYGKAERTWVLDRGQARRDLTAVLQVHMIMISSIGFSIWNLPQIALQLIIAGQVCQRSWRILVPVRIVVARQVFTNLHDCEHAAHVDVVVFALHADHRQTVAWYPAPSPAGTGSVRQIISLTSKFFSSERSHPIG